MRILIVGGISQSLINFRGPLIRAMLDQGHEVIACAGEPLPVVADTLRKWGGRFIPVSLARAGMSPRQDLRSFLELRGIMRDCHPDVVLAYTVKPVVWGTLAARAAGIKKIYCMIEGLGRAFMPIESVSHRISAIAVRSLYRIALPLCTKTFFLNRDDLNQFVAEKYITRNKTVQLNGIGVDLDWHNFEPIQKRVVRFLMIARLLKDKGVREYVSASIALRQRVSPELKCILLGDIDDNPSSVSQKELEGWIRENVIDYRGYAKDVRPFLRDCDVYVLPSYREGTPRTVLEAMSMGRPVITTDAPGCRETIRPKDGDSRPQTTDCNRFPTPSATNQAERIKDNESSTKQNESRVYEIFGKLKIGTNGILIPPRDAEALADAMRFFIDHPGQIAIMGRESRRYAEERYDVHKVNAVMMREMELMRP